MRRICLSIQSYRTQRTARHSRSEGGEGGRSKRANSWLRFPGGGSLKEAKALLEDFGGTDDRANCDGIAYVGDATRAKGDDQWLKKPES
jgi:hypothetical protein